MSDEQPGLFDPPAPAPMVCRCWLGDGQLQCDTPASCRPLLKDENDDAE